MLYNCSLPEVAAILEFGDFLVVVQLIHQPKSAEQQPKNHLTPGLLLPLFIALLFA